MNSRLLPRFALALIFAVISATAAFGSGKSPAPSDTVRTLLTLASQGNVKAMGHLSSCYRYGLGVPKDSAMASQLSIKAIEAGDKELLLHNIQLAKEGDVFSCMLLAQCFKEGKGVEKDISKSLPFLNIAAKKGCVDAQKDLGLIYMVQNKPQEAVKWFRSGADSGNQICIYWYGYLLLKGLGTAKNESLGAAYILRAANEGYLPAMNEAGICYLTGAGLPGNPEQAVVWFRKAALRNSGIAQWRLAQCYREGIGTPINYTQAIRWYGRAVRNDFANEFRQLFTDSVPSAPFVVYLHGLDAYAGKHYAQALKDFKSVEKAGVPDGKVMTATVLADPHYDRHDYLQAAKMLKEVPENPAALYILGTLYESGRGVEKDKAKALECLVKAATMDYAPALCRLGDMYFEGVGVDQNYKKAVYLYSLAYAQEQLTANAALRYGICCKDGLGMKANPTEASAILSSFRPSPATDLLRLLQQPKK